jgi:hypothetical protein
MIPHSSIDVALTPVVLEVCDVSTPTPANPGFISVTLAGLAGGPTRAPSPETMLHEGGGGTLLRTPSRRTAALHSHCLLANPNLPYALTQLATCDAARALLLRVAEAQHTRHGRPLRVRCQPASSGCYQSDAVWQPAASTIRVNCHNAQPTQVGSLLFELLNAHVRLPISPPSSHRRSTIHQAGPAAACR